MTFDDSEFAQQGIERYPALAKRRLAAIRLQSCLGYTRKLVEFECISRRQIVIEAIPQIDRKDHRHAQGREQRSCADHDELLMEKSKLQECPHMVEVCSSPQLRR
jgi:hypothetical protein